MHAPARADAPREKAVFLRNCWYVAAWAHELDDERVLARTIIGLPVVLWRDSAHEVVAFVDRC
jgi:vanillate O-demethylase monooxygenase subunit